MCEYPECLEGLVWQETAGSNIGVAFSSYAVLIRDMRGNEHLHFPVAEFYAFTTKDAKFKPSCGVPLTMPPRSGDTGFLRGRIHRRR